MAASRERFEDRVDAVCDQIRETLKRKRHDYGPGNIPRHGEFGVLVRVDDKTARLANLLGSGRDPAVVGESLRDTWLDVAGYAVLAVILRDLGPERYLALTSGEDHDGSE